MGDFLIEETLKSVAASKSPVAGEKWPALKPSYRKEKDAAGHPPVPNMEFSGDMLADLTFKDTADGIQIGFIGSDQAPKADGHVKFSGKDNGVRKRRFLPGEGQEYVSSIQKDVDQIIADAIVESMPFDTKELKDVDSKADLYSLFRDAWPDLTNAEIKATILRTPDIFAMLADLDLEDFL